MMVEGSKGNAFSSVKLWLPHSAVYLAFINRQGYFYVPNSKRSFTRLAALSLIFAPFNICGHCSCLLSMYETRMKCKRGRLQNIKPSTFSLLHHTFIHHHLCETQHSSALCPPFFFLLSSASLFFFPVFPVFLQTPTLFSLFSFGSVVPSSMKQLKALSTSLQHEGCTNTAP